MKFWELFSEKHSSPQQTNFCSIHERLTSKLPNAKEETLIKTACIAGLLARVAWVDFKLDTNELKSMNKSLIEWTKLDNNTVDAILSIAIEEIKNLAGLENHIYAHTLRDMLDQTERYNILLALFSLAGSDGEVENIESEEIRIIAKGLGLAPKHYLSARASVYEKLKALKM